MSAGGQYAGQAIGAVATGAVGGAARLVTGCAAGAVSAIRGMRALELPSAPAPQRPRVLEQFDISVAGSGSGVPTEMADVMAEFRRMRAEMKVRAASTAANTTAEHVQEFSAQDIQEVVILMAVVYLEALGRLEEALGFFLEVPHMVVVVVVVGAEYMDWAMQVGILIESVAVASDYQVDLGAEVGPADLEENFQEEVGPIVLAVLVGSLEAERDVLLESTLAKLKAADLPHLAWKGSLAGKPGILEHWIQRASLDLGGMHQLIERYWSQVLGVVVETYETYLRHGPLDRPAIRPMQPAQFPLNEADAVNFHSVELRLRDLLLALMPEDVKQACLSTRQTSTTDTLFSAYVSAGPGTGPDKDHTLQQVSKGRHVDVKATCDELQRWKFSTDRLATLGVAAPDPSVQLSSLKAIAHKMLESNEEVKHRYFGFLVTRGFSGGVANQAQ
ncbi:unnamed protein product, partial [Prorocentrum cordatum]